MASMVYGPIDRARNRGKFQPCPLSSRRGWAFGAARAFRGYKCTPDTASNTVTATVPVSAPGAIAILPPPQGVQFLSFKASLKIHLSQKPNDDTFELESSFTLNGSANDAIQPDKVPVKLQLGPFIGRSQSDRLNRTGIGLTLLSALSMGPSCTPRLSAQGCGAIASGPTQRTPI